MIHFLTAVVKKLRSGIPYLMLLFLLTTFTSCISYKSFVNYDGPPGFPEKPTDVNNFVEPTIQPGDILLINIASEDAVAIKPFVTGAGSSETGSSGTSYLVTNGGEIIMPTLGSIQVAGFTTTEFTVKLLDQLSPYFSSSPLVQVRLQNFKVFVNGEVGSPGVISVENERLSVVEAITQAGDFTQYALRDSVLLIREVNSQRTFGYLDFTSADLFQSPYFYLKQNDVLYVKPNEYITGSIRNEISTYVPYVSAGVSIIALILTISRN